MQTIKKLIARQILDAVNAEHPDAGLTEEEIASALEYPPDPGMGDLAFPCFRLSRALRRSPVQPVHPFSAKAFVDRGGRIPAPMQSLKN